MSEWSQWYRVVKKTGGDRKYLYLQRTRYVRGKKNPELECSSLGRMSASPQPRKRRRFDPMAALSVDQPRRSFINQLAIAAVGVEDEYGQRFDSLWNRTVNKVPEKSATEEPETEEPETEENAAVVGHGSGTETGESPS